MVFEDKFHMSVEENIFVAKRNIVDYIYKSARLEGLNVTYPSTYAIINSGLAQDLKNEEIITINNLKNAWHFMLDNTDFPTIYPFICEVNRIIGANLFHKAGFIRTVPVTIGGTSWKPQMPFEVDIKADIMDTLKIGNTTERSIVLMLILMRCQMFLDGNKRTAMLSANHEMICNGAGIISVPINLIEEFNAKLLYFYESGDIEDIKLFVYDNCIDGIDMTKLKEYGYADEYSFEDFKAMYKEKNKEGLSLDEVVNDIQNELKRTKQKGSLHDNSKCQSNR